MSDEITIDECQITKERHYILKDARRKDRVTICLIEMEEPSGKLFLVRGVAVRSDTDKFDHTIGTNTAYEYAIDAALRRSDAADIIRKRTVQIMRSTEGDKKLCGEFSFTRHSYFHPRLTWFEEQLMDAYIVA